MATQKIIEVGGRRWLAGMAWHGYAEKPSPTELRATGVEESADWVTVRVSTKGVQAGFCAPIEGEGARPRGLYSLGAAIADIEAQPWLGLYQLDTDLWWCIAVRDNQTILPSGDIVGDKETVMKAHQGLLGYDGWNHQKGTLTDLLPILRGGKGRAAYSRVKSLTPVPLARLLGPPVAAMLVFLAAVWLWHAHGQAVQQAEMRAQEAARARHSVPPPISPLLLLPAPDTWLQACKAVIEPQPIGQDGWGLTDASCIQGTVVLTWTRLDGATALSRPAGQLSRDGNKVLESIRLARLPHGRDFTSGLTNDANLFFGQMQTVGVQPTVSEPVLPPLLPGAAPAGSNQAIPEELVRFETPFTPWDMSFDSIPGLRLTELHQTQNGWTLTGDLYGR